MKKFLLIVIVLCLMAVPAGLYYLQYSILEGKDLKTLLVSRLEAALGRKVSVGAVQAGLFGLQASNIRVGGNTAFGEYDQLAAAKLSLAPDFMALLSKKIVIRSITLSNPVIEVRKAADGSFDFADIMAGREKQAPRPGESRLSLSVEAISIENARITFLDDAPGPFKAVLSALNLTGSFSSEGKIHLKGAGVLEDMADNLEFELQEVLKTPNGTKIRGTGSIKGLKVNAPMAYVKQAFPVSFDKGTADVKAFFDVDPSANRRAFNVSFDGREMTISHKSLPIPIESLTISAEADEKTVTVKNVDFSVAGIPIKAQGILGLGPNGAFEAKASIPRTSVNALLKAVSTSAGKSMPALLPSDASAALNHRELTGTIAFKVSARGLFSDPMGTLALTPELDIEGLKTVFKGVEVGPASLKATMDKGIVRISGLQAALPGAAVTGTIEFPAPGIPGIGSASGGSAATGQAGNSSSPAGRWTVDLDLESSEPGRFAVALATLSGNQAIAASTEKLPGKLGARLKWAGDPKTATAAISKGRIPAGARLEASLTGLTGAAIVAFLPPETLKKFSPSPFGRATAEITIDTTAKNQSLKGKITLNSLGFTSDTIAVPVKADGLMEISSDSFRTSGLVVTIGSSSVNVDLEGSALGSKSGEIALLDPEAMKNLAIKLSFSGTSFELADLSKAGILPPTFVPAGRIELSAGKLSGGAAGLTGGADVSMKEGKFDLFSKLPDGTLSKIPFTVPVKSLNAPLRLGPKGLTIEKAEADVCSSTGKPNVELITFSLDILNPPGAIGFGLRWKDLEVHRLMGANPWFSHVIKGSSEGGITLAGNLDKGISSIGGNGMATASGGEWEMKGPINNSLQALKQIPMPAEGILGKLGGVEGIISKAQGIVSLLDKARYSKITTAEPIAVDKGRITFKNISFFTPGGDFSALGSIDLTGTETAFDFSIDFGGLDLATVDSGGKKYIEGLAKDARTMPMRVRVHGTPLKPSAGWDSESIKSFFSGLGKAVLKTEISDRLFGKLGNKIPGGLMEILTGGKSQGDSTAGTTASQTPPVPQPSQPDASQDQTLEKPATIQDFLKQEEQKFKDKLKKKFKFF